MASNVVTLRSCIVGLPASGVSTTGRGTPTHHVPPYRFGETNHCRGCGRSQWYIGRTTAECAFCSTAIPLEAS